MTESPMDGPLPDSPETSEYNREPRPRAVKNASILIILFGIFGIIAAAFLLSLANDTVDHGESVNPAVYGLLYAQFALSATETVSGFFVWQGRNWARTVVIVICSLNLVGSFVSLFSGSFLQVISGAAINIGLLVMLNRYEVVHWCQ